MIKMQGKFRTGGDILIVQSDLGWQEASRSFITAYEMQSGQTLLVSYVPTKNYDLAERQTVDVLALQQNGVDTDSLQVLDHENPQLNGAFIFRQ